MSKKSDTSYAELERALRLDLAARTIADPDAPDEHVAAARRYLESDSALPTMDDVLSVDYQTREFLIRMFSSETSPEARERAVRAALAAL